MQKECWTGYETWAKTVSTDKLCLIDYSTFLSTSLVKPMTAVIALQPVIITVFSWHAIFALMTHIIISRLHTFSFNLHGLFFEFFSSFAVRLFFRQRPCSQFSCVSSLCFVQWRPVHHPISCVLSPHCPCVFLASFWQPLSSHRDGATHATMRMHETTLLCGNFSSFSVGWARKYASWRLETFAGKPLWNFLFKLWSRCRLKADGSRYSYRPRPTMSGHEWVSV